MRKLTIFFLVALLTGVNSCKPRETKVEEALLIEKKSIELKSDLMTPEVLWSFGRLSEPELSPDKKTVLYGVTYYDVTQNRGNRELYSIDVEGQDFKRITKTKSSEYQAMWSSDGKKIYFMSAETGAMQLWEMNPDGSNRKQITNIENGINGYKVSPDMKQLLYIADVSPEKQFQNLYAGLPKASGRVYNAVSYTHLTLPTKRIV